MSPLKYGATPWGNWERDDNNLPCFHADATRLQDAPAAPGHLIGNGRTALMLDAFGRIRLLGMDAARPREITPAADRAAGTLTLNLTTAGRTCALHLSELRTDAAPRLTWGAGYADFSGTVAPAEGTRVAFRAAVTADPDGNSLLSLTLDLDCLEGRLDDATLELSLETGLGDADPESRQRTLRHFCRNGIAMFTELDDAVGDIVLAGGAAWTAACTRRRLRLSRPVKAAPGAPFSARLLFGSLRDCSLSVVQDRLDKADPAAMRAAWARRLLTAAPARTPELWMQEECVWNAALLHALSLGDGKRKSRIFGTGAGTPPDGGWQNRAFPVRDLLLTCQARLESEPDMVLDTLRAVTASQAKSGRLPEQLGAAPAPDLQSAADRSDLEVWFILAWTEVIRRSLEADELLKERLPFVSGGEAPLWEHLRLAYRWVRDEIRTGNHGCLRLLAGDWNPLLSAAGAEGHGESVLTTAAAVYALERLAGVARQQHDSFFADELATWTGELRKAVDAAFDGHGFIRGYTDAGTPFGGAADGLYFLDVQAWAVLACGGTAPQRQTALQEALARHRTEDGQPLRCLARALPLPPPAALSHQPLPAGEGANGGIDLTAAAWFVHALAAQGRRDQLLPAWETFTQRRLALRFPGTPVPWRWALPVFASDLAGSRAGGPGLAEFPPRPLPDALALAWQEAALRRILALE